MAQIKELKLYHIHLLIFLNFHFHHISTIIYGIVILKDVHKRIVILFWFSRNWALYVPPHSAIYWLLAYNNYIYLKQVHFRENSETDVEVDWKFDFLVVLRKLKSLLIVWGRSGSFNLVKMRPDEREFWRKTPGIFDILTECL